MVAEVRLPLLCRLASFRMASPAASASPAPFTRTSKPSAERARDQLRDCNCGQLNGCPACTFDENCGNDNKPLLRASAIDVLNQLLGDEDRENLAEHLSDDEHGGGCRPVVFY